VAYTDFCARSGGSNLNAGTRTGNTTVPGTAADFTYALGNWVAATGVFTVASGNPSGDGVAVGDFASVHPEVAAQTFSGASGAVPAGWTGRWSVVNITWTEDAGGFLRGVAAANTRSLVAYNAADSISADVDVRVKFRTSSFGSTNNPGIGIALRGSGPAGTEVGAVVGMDSTTTIKYLRVTAGTFSNIGSATVTALSLNTWYQFRVRIVGTTLQAKVWLDGSAEPSTWDFTLADASVSATAGWQGLVVQGNGATTDYDDFSVALVTTPFVGRVTARDATTITVSLTAKSGTAPADGTGNRTLKIGGAWKGPDGPAAFPFGFLAAACTNAAGDQPFINMMNDAVYSVTAVVTHNQAVPVSGFSAAYRDTGRAIIDGGTSGTSYNVISLTAQAIRQFANIEVRNNGATGSATGLLFDSVNRILIRNCVVHDVRGHGFGATGNPGGELWFCEAYACNQSNTANLAGFSAGTPGTCTFFNCVSHDHVGSNAHGFVGSTLKCVNCIADTCGGNGFRATGNGGLLSCFQCAAYNCTSNGIEHASGADGQTTAVNCLLVNNGVRGVVGVASSSSTSTSGYVLNCAFYNNTSGQVTNVQTDNIIGSITLTGNPFVDAANGDFRLNNTAGAGAACRGAGYGTFTQTAASYAGTLGYPDVGAAQHLDAGGGTTVNVIAAGRGRVAVRERHVFKSRATIMAGSVYVPVVRPPRQIVRRSEFAPRRAAAVIPQLVTVPIPRPRAVVYSVRPGPPVRTLLSCPAPYPVPVMVRGRPYPVCVTRRFPVAAIVQPPTVNTTVLVTTKRTVR
jgi:hypothetical protein